jgi:hypothetical protein
MVFGSLKVGHFFNSLLRTTFILQAKEYSTNNGNSWNQLHIIQTVYKKFIQGTTPIGAKWFIIIF